MRGCLVALFLIAPLARPALAQDTAAPAPQSTPDFLFGRPAGSVAIRGSWLWSRARSDWYDFVTDQLTIDRRDFNAPGMAADVAITATDRLAATIGVDYSRVAANSEYRKFVDNRRQPINQRTELRQASITGGVKFALRPPGRRVSSYAWLPRTVTPYVAAGGGAIWYSLAQSGDFVDFVDLSVFPDVFRSDGWAPTAHVGAGVDVRLARRLNATLDGRYRWAAGRLSRQWVDFDPVDLSGLRLSAGITLPF